MSTEAAVFALELISTVPASTMVSTANNWFASFTRLVCVYEFTIHMSRACLYEILAEP